jgi:hypothetical protein
MASSDETSADVGETMSGAEPARPVQTPAPAKYPATREEALAMLNAMSDDELADLMFPETARPAAVAGPAESPAMRPGLLPGTARVPTTAPASAPPPAPATLSPAEPAAAPAETPAKSIEQPPGGVCSPAGQAASGQWWFCLSIGARKPARPAERQVPNGFNVDLSSAGQGH